eukprot:c21152_g1_i1 orf=65-1579(+)
MALGALSRRHVQSICNKGRTVSIGIRDLATQDVAAEHGHDESTSMLKRTFPSLHDPLPGLEQPSFLPDFTRTAETIITTHSNGLRIGSQNSRGPCVSVGLLVDSGCIYEDSKSCGVSHLLEKMAFHSTKNRSKARIAQEAQAIGINFTSSSARDQMLYMGHGIKTFLPQIVEILVDSVRNAVFEELEFKEKLLVIKEEVKDLENNPESLLISSLHSVGYSGDYSRSFFAPESSMARLNGETLRKFVDDNFTASRMVLSAAGVDHHEFLAVVEPLLSDLPKMPSPPMPKFKYVGGDWRKLEESPVTHFALAFEVPNGWQNERLANCLTVLKFLLGGGESFSVGGPGKGMYTRFCRHALNKFTELQSIRAFSSIYNHTGLFGVYVCSNSEFAPEAVDIACKELISIPARGQVTKQEFQRAKNATVSAALMSLESKAVVAEDVACQILSYGQRREMHHYIAEIRNLTLEDIEQAAREILSTPLTMASWGAVKGVPTYSNVEKRFRSL